MATRMLEEIREQPEILGQILDEEWPAVLVAVRSVRARGFRCAMLVARGTSYNAARYAKHLFETIRGVPAALASPSVFTLYESEPNLDGIPVVGISQSGESRDVLETVCGSEALGRARSP